MLYQSKTREELEREEREKSKKESGAPERIFFILILIALYMFYYTSNAKTFDGTVVDVISGDEFKVESEGKIFTVRLRDVYSPVRGQPYFKEAGKFTKKITTKKIVTVKYHGKPKDGFILADVYLENGSELKNELVKNGFAWRWKHALNYQLFSLQNDAKSLKKGLWKEKKPIPPWEWANTKEKK